MDPNKRITSEQAMQDNYFIEEPSHTTEWVKPLSDILIKPCHNGIMHR